jgi:hypothetical protein
MQAILERILEQYGKSMAVAFGLGLLFALMLLPGISGAQPAGQTERVRERAEQRAEKARAAAEERGEVKRAEAETRLADKKLEICERREQKVQNIMARISDRGDKHLDVFTKISDRVQTFYTDKNLTVANYDELVANVDKKKQAAEAQVAAIREASVEFNCDSEDPKGVAWAFKDDMKAQVAALKEYRTAVKDLLVAVKKSLGEAEGSESESETEETQEGAN